MKNGNNAYKGIPANPKIEKVNFLPNLSLKTDHPILPTKLPNDNIKTY